MRRIVLPALALALATPVSAADLAPTAQAVATAAAAGKAAYKLGEGYSLKAHVLYAVKDARNIDPADGEVDAVVVGTPLERTRHAGYLAARTKQKASAQDCYRAAGLPPGQLAILVFAHGRDAEDEAFPQEFGSARIVFDDGVADAVTIERGRPSEGIYPLAEVDRMRSVAVVTYRFDLSRWPDAGARKGRLRFTDGGGKRFDIPIDLARFE